MLAVGLVDHDQGSETVEVYGSARLGKQLVLVVAR